jgi:subtilisin family serine protease
MRLRVGSTIVLALIVSAAAVGDSATAHPTFTSHRSPTSRADEPSKFPWGSRAGRVVPGRIVVVWRHGVMATDKRALATRLRTSRLSPTPGLGVDVVRVPAGLSTGAAIRGYRRSPLVRFAEPDRIASVAALPNDPLIPQQWALHNTGQPHETSDVGLGAGQTTRGTAHADVHATQAWAAQTAHRRVVVAVIDTGVDIDHPDLVNSLWVNAAEQGGVGHTDDDHNGFVDDVSGWDFKDHDADPTPASGTANSHGTHIAGVIASEQDNAVGVSGVCPDCRIMALRIGAASGFTLGDELKAIAYAIQNHADVINLSFGSVIWSPAERAAIGKAGNRGILVVAAAGNSSADNDIQFYDSDKAHAVPALAPLYPATYTLSNILSVAASNDRDQYGYFSQCRGRVALWHCAFTSWGHDSVDVAAPGVDILSTVRVGEGSGSYNDCEVSDGTSFASPMVAGIAGLVLSEHPRYSATGVKNAIMNSVDHPKALKLYDGWGDVTRVGKQALSGHFTRTQGRVNAFAALTAPTKNATPPTDGNIDGATYIKTKRTGSVVWPADSNDVYKKRLVRGVKYDVKLNGPKGRDLDLWVWRPGTKEIFEFTAGCFRQGGTCPAFQAVSGGKGADEEVVFKAPKAGLFFIQVNDWYSRGSYTLTVKKL